VHERSGFGLHGLFAGVDTHGTIEHQEKRGFLHAVVAERLPGTQLDEDGALGAFSRMQHDGRSRAVGHLDFGKPPDAHEQDVTAPPSTLPRFTRLAAMPLAVDRYALGPLQTNCYVVRSERGAPECAVVDPGGDAAQLRLELARLDTVCAGILITHGHFDHLGGVADLAEGTGAEVWMPEGERERLERFPEFAPVGVPGRPHAPEHLLSGGETLEVAGISFECLAVPGHSPAHIAFHAEGELFSGDLLFAGSVGRVDLPGSDWDTLLASVRMLAERLPPETVVHPGHGPETTLGVELARNPFLAELRTQA
jgi:hydroxyacylglutathione hydrolase